jgi:histidine triad (HIT) family protein
VFETDRCLAFLDINPVVRGHVLCIPKQEVDYIFDLDDDLFCELHLFAKRVAKGLKKVCPCIKVGEAVVGIDVPHTHIHLMPLNKPGDLNFAHHVEMSADELRELAARIGAAIE